MEAFRYHVYICDQKKPEGAPSCSARGSAQVIEALRRELLSKGLADQVQVTTCGSIGLCERGPNMVVYPDGVWYSGLTPENIAEIVSEHFQEGRVVERLANLDTRMLREEIDSNRGKMLASMKARDEAGAIPDDLMQTIQGFRQSRIILSAVELDIFSAVGDGATAEKVAKKLKLDPRATEMLLNALTSLGLLEKSENIFRNTPVSSRYLSDGGQDDSRASLMHTVNLWNRWSNLSESVRKGSAAEFMEQAERAKADTEAFIAAMHKNASFRAPQVIRAINLDGVKRVLDVGGGSAAYSMAFVKANKDIEAVVFDLPNVAPLTKKYIKSARLEKRITTQAGDMRTDDFGTDFDIVFISAICHMNSPVENIALFEKSFKALKSGGRIVMQDFILTADKTSPTSGALFAINMLVGTKSGSTYSQDEYRQWLQTAGFDEITRVPLPGPTGLMTGRRP